MGSLEKESVGLNWRENTLWSRDGCISTLCLGRGGKDTEDNGRKALWQG